MNYKYSFQNFNEETMARALGRGLPISQKHGVELSNAIRGMSVAKAKTFLKGVMELEQPVKFTRFNQDLGHKKKCGPARYPVKTAKYFLGLLELAEANASFKGINTADLKIIHVSAQKAAGRWHFGRQRRRRFKSSHVEMVVEESAPERRTPAKPAAKKEAETKEVKPAQPVGEKPKAEVKPKEEVKAKAEEKPNAKEAEKPKAEAAKIKTEVKKEVKAEAKPVPKEAAKAEEKKKAPKDSESKPQPENKKKKEEGTKK